MSSIVQQFRRVVDEYLLSSSNVTLPSVLGLLAISGSALATFGYRPRIFLKNGKWELDFQVAPMRLVEKYRDFESVFDINLLDIESGMVCVAGKGKVTHQRLEQREAANILIRGDRQQIVKRIVELLNSALVRQRK